VWNAKKQATRSVNCLWIDEGLAEYLAGGVRYLRDLQMNLEDEFADGPLAMSDLIGNINVLWHDNSKNAKAYVQSYFMVDYLMHRAPVERDSLAKIEALLGKVSTDVPLEKAVFEVYGLPYAEFEKGWKRHLSTGVKALK